MASDFALLKKYVESRDAHAFSQLIHRHAGLVYGTCLRVTRNTHDAEDLAQECFMELARRASSVTSSVVGWLHTLATHRSIDFIRRSATRRTHEDKSMTEGNEETEPSWKDIAPVVDEALEELPEELRIPLVLHYLHGHNQTEIAKSLAINQSSVSRRLESGVEQLRQKLKQSGIVASIAVLSTLLKTNAVTAAPATLLASLGKMALVEAGKSAVASGSVSTTAGAATGASTSSSGAITAFIGTSAGKLAAITVSGVVAVGGVAVYHHMHDPKFLRNDEEENVSALDEHRTNRNLTANLGQDDEQGAVNAALERDNIRLRSDLASLRLELDQQMAKHASLETELARAKTLNRQQSRIIDSFNRHGTFRPDKQWFSPKFQPQEPLLEILELDDAQEKQLSALGAETLKRIQTWEVANVNELEYTSTTVSFEIPPGESHIEGEKTRFAERIGFIIDHDDLAHLQKAIDHVFGPLESRRRVTYSLVTNENAKGNWKLNVDFFSQPGAKMQSQEMTFFKPLVPDSVPTRYSHLFAAEE